ncbi:hypothetical protein OF117_05345 [Geodermatophilus sp. YIM 151500]|uniref:hypothetical protein n=1 Tax=Geodermatophilus sp. YIM 151500 TaxID=2984531 RepID=UPI0021E411ED|nr:hypothetical protein [Geodermatophilus sp. YIM 151500]MCV2488780.1 hypothetical protein [Geodermatophilus sp. YIM 151500]
MTTSAVRLAALLALAVLLPACAAGAGGDAGAPADPAASPSGDAPGPDAAAPVIQVAHTGGFVTPQMLAGRLPLATVYADGRVITEGPVPAIYPGPALPNLQVQRVEPARVGELVDRALAAGVGSAADLGSPPVADAPSTRFTVVTGGGTETLEVYALGVTGLPGTPADGLTAEQQQARAELSALLDELIAPAGADSERYVPEAVAAVATGWTDPGDGLTQPEVVWPGPPLPGEALDERLGLSCVAARAEAAQAVLEAAASANAVTPWVDDEGRRWSLLLRPLLPHESGCADLVEG